MPLQRIAITSFIASLPKHQREVLSVIADEGPDKIVSIAEKLHHISHTQPPSPAHVNHIFNSNDDMNRRLNQLEEKFDRLLKSVESLTIQQRGRPQYSSNKETSRYRSQSNNKFRYNSESKNCYYHQKFSDKATKCTCNHLN